MERVKSDLAAAEEKAAAIEAQQSKSLEELESQFRQEMETLQEYLKTQEKEFVAEIERTKVAFCFCAFRVGKRVRGKSFWKTQDFPILLADYIREV